MPLMVFPLVVVTMLGLNNLQIRPVMIGVQISFQIKVIIFGKKYPQSIHSKDIAAFNTLS